jgi:hypothetical protein
VFCQSHFLFIEENETWSHHHPINLLNARAGHDRGCLHGYWKKVSNEKKTGIQGTCANKWLQNRAEKSSV